MLVEHVPFDCALPLRAWSKDPNKSNTDNLLYLIESYSQAYRRMLSEIRRLEAEAANPDSYGQHQAKDSEYSEIQKLVDASIAHLDPEAE